MQSQRFKYLKYPRGRTPKPPFLVTIEFYYSMRLCTRSCLRRSPHIIFYHYVFDSYSYLLARSLHRITLIAFKEKGPCSLQKMKGAGRLGTPFQSLIYASDAISALQILKNF